LFHTPGDPPFMHIFWEEEVPLLLKGCAQLNLDPERSQHAATKWTNYVLPNSEDRADAW